MFKKLFQSVKREVIKSKVEKLIEEFPAERFIGTVRVSARSQVELTCDILHAAVQVVRANKSTIAELALQVKSYVDSEACQSLVKEIKQAFKDKMKADEAMSEALEASMENYKDMVNKELSL